APWLRPKGVMVRRRWLLRIPCLLVAVTVGWTLALAAPAGAARKHRRAPVNMTLPSITGGMNEGQTLSASPGTWTNSPTSYTYQWQRCTSNGNCVNIGAPGASSTYVSQLADVGDDLDVVVTAQNGSGSGTATSVAVGPIVGS